MNRHEPTLWSDENGTQRRVPGRNRRLKPTCIKSDEVLRQYVFRRTNGTCAWCGSLGELWLTIDHVIPRAARAGNHPDNLQALCEACNARKANSWDKPIVAAVRAAFEQEARAQRHAPGGTQDGAR